MNIITKQEEKLLLAIRKNPSLAECFFEMIDIAGENLGNIELADEAEEAVVQSIEKTGKEVLTLWAQNLQNQLADKAKIEIQTRSHEKKTSNGIRH